MSEPANRRDFLQQAAAAATGAAVGQAAAGQERAAHTLLPTVRLGQHEITRLIIGGNPIYGHSHFNRLLSGHQTAWHTPDRVLELLRRCEEVGINTWQNSYAPRTLEDLDRYRKAGGRMNWLCLGKPDWDQLPQNINDAAKRGPIGIAPHGALAERLYRQNRLGTLTDLLRRIRDQGVLVGLSAHNPELIEMAEERSWDVDYYMCCLYYLTRPREEFEKIAAGRNLLAVRPAANAPGGAAREKALPGVQGARRRPPHPRHQRDSPVLPDRPGQYQANRCHDRRHVSAARRSGGPECQHGA
jgi:hypothetical protein